MATFRSGPSSGLPSISDLDGYTLRDYQFPPTTSYPPSNDDNFGFDPPSNKPSTMNMYQTYSPPNDLSMSGWPEFEREGDVKETVEPPVDLDAFDVDNFISSTLSSTETAVARYGQMTPPRSHSAVSSHSRDIASSPKAAPERKKSKAQANPTEGAAKPGRKRKSTRKASIASIASIASDISEPLDGSKRKQSLEKNRLAAAKCRINKKEKTELLQRDSHDKAVQNSYLKDQIMRMKDEVQQMNAILLAHANCEGCRSPEGLQAHLSQLGSDFFNHQHVENGIPSFIEYPPMDYSPLSAVQDSFFPTTNNRPQMVNPPLPEFTRGAEFEVHTPHGD